MYMPAGDRIVALEPETGKELWSYEVNGIASFRGVSYWPGDRNNPPRVIFTTSHKMMACSMPRPERSIRGLGTKARTSARRWRMTVRRRFIRIFSSWEPTLRAGRSAPVNPALDQARRPDSGGNTPTMSAPARNSGRSILLFRQPGEPGNETWANDSWKNRTGNNVWAFASDRG